MTEYNATLFEADHVTVNGCDAEPTASLHSSNIRTLVFSDKSVVEFEEQRIELDSEGYAYAFDQESCNPGLQFMRRVPLTPGQGELPN
jgi:hypothetical protein